MQREPNREFVIVEVDEVLLARPLGHLANELHVVGEAEFVGLHVDGQVVPGSDDAGGQQQHEMVEVGVRERHLEVVIDERQDARRDVCRIGDRGRDRLQHPVFRDAIDRDGHMQQHAVEPVLVHEVAASVEQSEQVGLERPQVL